VTSIATANDQIKGTLEAPPNRSVWLDRNNLQEWITFEDIDRLHVLGGGTLNGNGQQWWINSCKLNKSMVIFLPDQKRKVLELIKHRSSEHLQLLTLDNPFLGGVCFVSIHQRCLKGPTVPFLALHFVPEGSVHPR
jgi:hypothetical protein